MIESRIDTRSDTYLSQRDDMLALVEEVRSHERTVIKRGEKARGKFEYREQLMPRERLDLLLDPGAPFVELSTLAGFGMHDDKKTPSGGGNVVGIGFVSGVRCLVNASDSAIKGGSITPMGLRKSLRAQEVALRERLPSVSLIESGGANLMYQSEIFVDGGRVFANMARLSAAGIPQITVVHGSSTAGGAYMPGLSDYVIAVRNRAKIFLAGPPLVKAALGEEADDETLGGAEMHATISGTAEYLADDDAHAVSLARQVVASLGWNEHTAPARRESYLPPRYDPEELAGAVPTDVRQPYDVREIVARVVDGSEFLEFKSGYGRNTVCGHAAIHGHRVGVIGNNGPIFPQGSVKAAQFMQLCEQAGIPIVFLMNTTGYMVGKDAEQMGAIKHGSKMIQAVANTTVPKITMVVGGAYGAGNYGMCGRGYDPDFIFSWPNARVAVMGGDQAATVMKMITAAKHKRKGLPLNEAALDMMAGEIKKRLDRESTALFATARLWDDGIIDPRDTRNVLGFCLDTCAEARARTLRPNSFGVARG
jgi:geranyl-CoA carboxylase beta subunit